MKLSRHTAARVLAAAETVRHDHVVKRATGACAPDADAPAAWVRACGLLLDAASTEHVRERLLSPLHSVVAEQVVAILLAAAVAREPGARVTPAEAHAAMELAEDVADALQALRGPLRGYARRWIGDEHAADDIVQQASLRLLAYARAHPAQMRELLDGAIRPFAYVTVKRLCLNWLRDRPDDASYDQLVAAPQGPPLAGGAAAIPDDDGRPLFATADPRSPMTRFGIACDGLVDLLARCDGVLDRQVAEGRVSSRQRDGVAHALRAVLVKRATGLHHLRAGRYEIWEVLTDLEGLRRFGAESLLVSGTTPSTLRKAACGRRLATVEAIIDAARAERAAEDDDLRAAA